MFVNPGLWTCSKDQRFRFQSPLFWHSESEKVACCWKDLCSCVLLLCACSVIYLTILQDGASTTRTLETTQFRLIRDSLDISCEQAAICVRQRHTEQKMVRGSKQRRSVNPLYMRSEFNEYMNRYLVCDEVIRECYKKYIAALINSTLEVYLHRAAWPLFWQMKELRHHLVF